MALINQNALFDKLQLYIDKKIEALPYRLIEIFEYYGLKEILPYLDEIQIVADNIEAVVIVAELAPWLEIIVSPEVIKAILDAAKNADIAAAAATVASLASWRAEAEAMTSDSYAKEPYNVNVKEYVSNGDGTFHVIITTSYSSLHWSITAEAIASGLILQGLWDPNSGVAPVTLDDPNNPGTPIPYRNGLYWLISADSADQVTPDPVYGGPYLVDDKILYLDSEAAPYKPWLRLRDFVRWQNIVDVPINISNALDKAGFQAGSFMTGDLEVARSTPKLIMNDIGLTNQKTAISTDEIGRFTIDAITDADTFIRSYFIVEEDAKTLQTTVTDILYDGKELYHTGNTGPDSGLDADTVDGIQGADMIIKKEGGDIDLLLTPGTYGSTTFANNPGDSSTKGTLLVIGGKTSIGEITQYYVDTNNRMFIRSVATGVLGNWGQMGTMIFDGTVLSITL